ncbi:hypothetical protein SEA_SPOOKY_64 [Gordonia phage Spooky]|nr:hypothetical protein SEA_SPOOKY_64 [Gordonia phage Spooky]
MSDSRERARAALEDRDNLDLALNPAPVVRDLLADLDRVVALRDKWAAAKTWDGQPAIVVHAFAAELTQALGGDAP